jgi:hypothetical protein
MASKSDIEAGRAFVRLYVKKTELERGLLQAKARLKDFGNGLKAVGTAFMASGTAIVAPILAAAKHFADFGSQLNDMSARTGISTNALDELAYGAEQTGQSIETVEGSIRKMQKSIGDAAGGSKAATEALDALGLSVGQLQGFSPDRQFALIAERLTAIQDPTARAAAAMNIFGRSGTALLPLMANLDELTAKAREVGRSMSAEQAAAADALGDAWDDARSAAGGLANAIGAAVAPKLTELLEKTLESLTTARQWIDAHQEMAFTALKAGIAIGGIGAAFTALGAPALAAASMLDVAAKAVAGLRIAFAFLALHPVIAVLGGLTLALGAAYVATRKLAAAGLELEEWQSRELETTRARQSEEKKLAARLEELAGKQRLTSAEMKEAESIIDRLRAQYGVTGATIDKTNGTVQIASGYFDQLALSMQRVEKVKLDAALRENLAQQTKVMDELSKRGGTSLGFLTEYAEVQEFTEQLEELQKAQNRLIRQKADLMGVPMPGEAAPPAGSPADDENDATSLDVDLKAAEKSAKDLADFRQKLDDDLHNARIDQIKDEEERELAGIRAKYEKERAELRQMRKDAAAGSGDKSPLDMALGTVETNRQREMAEIDRPPLPPAEAARLKSLKTELAGLEASPIDLDTGPAALRLKALRSQIAELETKQRPQISVAEREERTAQINRRHDALATAAARATLPQIETERQTKLDETRNTAIADRGRLALANFEPEIKAKAAADIDEAEAERIAAINAKYDERKKQLEETIALQERLNEAQAAEEATVTQEHAERRKKAEKDAIYETAKLQLELDKQRQTSDPWKSGLAEELRLLDLEKEKALADLAAEGTLDPALVEQTNKQYALRGQMASEAETARLSDQAASYSAPSALIRGTAEEYNASIKAQQEDRLQTLAKQQVDTIKAQHETQIKQLAEAVELNHRIIDLVRGQPVVMGATP